MGYFGVKAGFSNADSEEKIISDVFEEINQKDSELVLFFCSSRLNQVKISEAMKKKSGEPNFSSAKFVGCTTCGEITPCGFQNHSFTAMSFSSDRMKVGIGIGEEIIDDPISAAKNAVIEAAHQLGTTPENLDEGYVGIMLVDGTCGVEEYIMLGITRVARRLKIVGGSAGDDFCFNNVFLHLNHKIYHNAVILVLLKTDIPFEIVSTNSYLPGEKTLKVTKADSEKRVVYEFNGRPAALEYSRAVGVVFRELNPHIFMAHPLGLHIGENYYLRSPQGVEQDGALKFFSHTGEDTRLTIMKPGNLVSETEKAVRAVKERLGDISAIVVFNCILRYIEYEEERNIPEIFNILNIAPLCGFNTYGEQCDGLHINQTMTMLVFGRI